LDQNNGYWVDLDIQQTGNRLTGNGGFTSKQSTGGTSSVFGTVEPAFHAGEGELEGKVDGNAISIIAHWKGEGSIGEYTGTVSPQGWLEGDTKDRMHPESKAHWTSVDNKAKCMDVTAPAAPATDTRPVRKLGKRLPGTSQTSTLPQHEYATATTPATIYVEPGGEAFKDANGKDIGMSVGSKALVLEKRTNPIWYRLQTPPLTPRPGWVWGDDVTLGP
jgi:hypothetical protein